MQSFDASQYHFSPQSAVPSPDELEALSFRHAYMIEVLPLSSGNWAIFRALKLRFICQAEEVLEAVALVKAEIQVEREGEAARIEATKAARQAKTNPWANLSLEDLGL